MGLSWWRLLLVFSVCGFVCSLKQVTHNPQNNIICPQGLLNCSVKPTDPLRAHDVDCGPVLLCSLTVKSKLCCYDEHCKPCLWINVQLTFIPDAEFEEDGEGSGYDHDNRGAWDSGCVSLPDNTTKGQSATDYHLCEHQLGYQGMPAAVTICYNSAGKLPTLCKRLDFIVSSARGHNTFKMTLVEYEDVDFGKKMKISVRSFSQSAEVEVPTLKTVCSSPLHKHITECKGPRVSYVLDKQDGVVKVNYEAGDASEPQLCMKRGKEGKCRRLTSNVIPLELITDCTCFQAWKQGSGRVEFCPFEQNQEFKENVLRNVSVLVYHTKTYDGQPVLGWDLSAPCRIKAELWPCHVQADGKCTEIHGFRQQCTNETQWEENVTMLWASGSFVNIKFRNHQQLCVMVQADGTLPHYHCQLSLKRQYWSLFIPLALVIVLLTVFGILLLVNKLKRWISGWERQCHSQDTRRQVLLLHSSATDHQERLVCKLGQMFSELGFDVFLDLCYQTELGSLGPAPWFHSKLSHVQKHGGKVLLMLSPSTLQYAEWYWNLHKKGKEKIPKNVSACSADVLGAALGCILADRQKGGAPQRFVLLQYDNIKNLINEESDVPELLRGLPLYKLPSQTQGLLGELCSESLNSLSGTLKKMWWMKRAQRKLSRGLQNVCNDERARTESMLTQEEALSLDMEDVYLKKEQL
ncbi:uncharacterized protein il17rc [Triplophysa rosa]|uniref:Interleukin-17 receptor C n=1 Tax=Triplophysa rosa TaxID=992332 RepID=A0A9W7TFS2_TRIRA|nr:uncharacterized protein il17rc [Triplophysa rosa]XP_057217645.1 uncharacterized protein il17rc [Triplophysa rosa]KAI7795249.1 putative interleukin-17 receptor C [Triplophysa rosa]